MVPIEIIATQVGVAVSGLNFEDAIADLKDRNIEGSAAEVVDRDPLLGRPAEAVRELKAELEEATLARGRLRLWLEFIALNCASHEAKEFAGEALIGRHVPEGFSE